MKYCPHRTKAVKPEEMVLVTLPNN